MIVVGHHPEEQLLEFARTWCALIALGNWEDALAMLDEPNHRGLVWTRETVLAVLNETFSDGTRFAKEFGRPVVTAPDAARGKERHFFGQTTGGSY